MVCLKKHSHKNNPHFMLTIMLCQEDFWGNGTGKHHIFLRCHPEAVDFQFYGFML